MTAPLDPAEVTAAVAARLETALALLTQGDLGAAEALLAEILALQPGHFRALHGLGLLRSRQGDHHGAAEVFRRQLEVAPGSALAHLNRGIALWNLNRPEEALGHYQTVLELQPGSPEALLHTAAAQQYLGRPEAALATLDELLAAQPSGPGLLLRGQVLKDLLRLEEALVSLEQARELEPGLEGLAGALQGVLAALGPAGLSRVLPRLATPALDVLPDHFVPLFYWTADPQAVLAAAQQICTLGHGGSHFADNLLTWGRNLSMLDDAPFVAAWQGNLETDADRSILWRRYVLACAGYHCLHLDGDFVECGAYTGVGIKTVVDYLGGPLFPRTFWGYDAFQHDPGMANHAMPAHGAGLFQRVQGKFADYPQVKLIQGLLPQSLAGQSPERIAYLHLDLNQAAAELAVLEALFPRMVPGAVLILDDYEWTGYRKQKLAEDQWFQDRQYRVMPLPTGQGLIIKR